MIKKETIYIYTVLIYTLWYEFSNVFAIQRDFGKKKFTKNSYLKYTLDIIGILWKWNNGKVAEALFAFVYDFHYE